MWKILTPLGVKYFRILQTSFKYQTIFTIMSSFSHLHVHTQYSLLDGAASIKALYKKAIDDKMPALAISDHGNMFGAFQFVAEAYKHRVDPDDKKAP